MMHHEILKEFEQNVRKAEREELAAHVEGIRAHHECICGAFLPDCLIGYHTCGAFIGNTPTESEGMTGYNRALDDLLAHLRQSDAPQGCCENGDFDDGHDCHKKAPQGDNTQ